MCIPPQQQKKIASYNNITITTAKFTTKEMAKV